MTVDTKRPWKELTGYDDLEAAVFSQLYQVAFAFDRIADALTRIAAVLEVKL